MQALIIKNKKFRANWLSPNVELNSFIEAALTKSKLVAAVPGKLNLNKSAKSKIRNICVVTGRTRANHLEYKLSRLKLKFYAEAGLIPGLKKI